ncbi:MAG: hypothetical protein ACXVGI_10130 [Mycobacteriaceae bacterium]
MNHRRIAGVIAAATVVAISQASMVWAAPSVPALTAGQKATVYRALISRGASAPVAREVSEDPSMARAVGVSSGSSEAHGGATLPQGMALPMSVGSSCSGSSGWVSRSQWINNVYGGRIMSASLVTNFCYNGSSVTYAWSSKSESVTSLGSVGGWSFSSWAEFAEGWYSYNNRTNGGVATVAQADFQECIIRIGCLGSAQLIMRTYAHYDGTSYSSGVSLGG